ncbi:MAG: ABC transporter substrate-binding protein, partial [Deltaproteobacteria bacterium]|nr:ABC transporter substrate-binding protein [Deltaproteobacteria bacterium]
KEFVAQYKARFGIEPEAYAVYAYDATKAVLQAIARVNEKDRAKIVDAVAATKDFEGALGTWSFDANGDTSLKLLSVNTVKSGAFTFVKSVSGAL